MEAPIVYWGYISICLRRHSSLSLRNTLTVDSAGHDRRLFIEIVNLQLSSESMCMYPPEL